MSKKVFAMTVQELGDAFEERVANNLGGRLQIGSGRVKVPTLRSDVVATPFLIECKATKETSITLKSDIWYDVVHKASETMWLPSYAVSVADSFGNTYDFVGIESKYISDEHLHEACPNSLMQVFDMKKTKKVSCLVDCYKNRQYIQVNLEKDGTKTKLNFIPVNRLKIVFRDIVRQLV